MWVGLYARHPLPPGSVPHSANPHRLPMLITPGDTLAHTFPKTLRPWPQRQIES